MSNADLSQQNLKNIELHQQAKAIHEKAHQLRGGLPAHLKMFPDIKHALALMESMSDLLMKITDPQGEQNHA